VTLDHGRPWEPLSGNFPYVPVHDLLIHKRENGIVVGSHARAARPSLDEAPRTGGVVNQGQGRQGCQGTTIDATTGFNNFAIDLQLAPEKHDPIDAKSRNPKTIDEKMADPFLANRATCLEVVDYKVELCVGATMATVDWKITEANDAGMEPIRRRG